MTRRGRAADDERTTRKIPVAGRSRKRVEHRLVDRRHGRVPGRPLRPDPVDDVRRRGSRGCTRRSRRRRATPAARPPDRGCASSGMRLRQRSSGPSRSVAATLPADARRFDAVSGDELRRARRARREQQQRLRLLGSLGSRRRGTRTPSPTSTTAMPAATAAARAGPSSPGGTTTASGRSTPSSRSYWAWGWSTASGAHPPPATAPRTATARSGPFGRASTTRPGRRTASAATRSASSP